MNTWTLPENQNNRKFNDDEGGSDTNCSKSTWNNLEKAGKILGEIVW